MECKICNKKSENLEIHHIIPKSRGGSDKKSNLIKLCSECHGLAHDVSFINERGGLIKEGIIKIKEKDDIARKWLIDNESLVDKKITELYYKDEDKHMLVCLLLKKGKLKASHIREWVEVGRVSFKTTFTIF